MIKKIIKEELENSSSDSKIYTFKLLISEYEKLNKEINLLLNYIRDNYDKINDDDIKISELHDKKKERYNLQVKITRYPLGFIDKKDIKNVDEYNDLLRKQKMYSINQEQDKNNYSM